MGWGAPAGPVLVGRHSVAIVPDVAGEVADVPVQPNVPLKAGDVLFRIDPTTFEAQVNAVQAQLSLAELRFSQMSQLQRADSGRAFDVQQREAEVKQLQAQLDGAKWNLDRTVVRAPSDGYVTNLVLRKGARVSNLSLSPVMAFIETAVTLVVVQVPQNDARYLESGQPVELTFKFLPGQILTGKVEAVLQAIATGQEAASGSAAMPRDIEAAPFVALDDAQAARLLPAGSAGTAAIFTDHVKASHVIRKVLLRQQAILNYILPF
jgi:RND family efflux transporter MFP subunit